jgi:hypothetical protein
VEGVIASIAKVFIGTDKLLTLLKQEAERDPEQRELQKALKEDKQLKPVTRLAGYRAIWDRLSLEEDFVILDGHRIIVPIKSRREVLQKFHESHQGQTCTAARARQLYFWPGITNEVGWTACLLRNLACLSPMLMLLALSTCFTLVS